VAKEMREFAAVCGKYGKTQEETVNSSGITEKKLSNDC